MRGPSWLPTHRHVKTGSFYCKLMEGLREADLEPVVIYESDNGMIWVRPRSEFNDGRFELLPPRPLVGADGHLELVNLAMGALLHGPVASPPRTVRATIDLIIRAVRPAIEAMARAQLNSGV